MKILKKAKEILGKKSSKKVYCFFDRKHFIEKENNPISPYFNTTERLMEAIYGSRNESVFDKHQWGFTQKTLEGYINNAGFKNIKVRKIYEAHDMGCLIATASK